MSTASIAALLRRPAPGPGQTPVTAGAASTAATAIPAGARRVWLSATQDAHVRFGSASVGAATSSDLRIGAGAPVLFDIEGETHWRAIRAGGADAVITWVAL